MIRVAMIVPAAGLSLRHPPNKLLLDLDGVPVIVRALSVFQGMGIDLFVVLGHQEDEVRNVVEGAEIKEVRYVHNPDYSSGMASSMKAGLNAVGGSYDYCGISLADKPFIRRETLTTLLSVLEKKTPLILAPSHNDQAGHPIFFHISLLDELMSAQGETGGREVREKHRSETVLMPVKDEGVVLDMDEFLERQRG
ncbi:MAG: nucleotidyltransferase family protein [bacterium]